MLFRELRSLDVFPDDRLVVIVFDAKVKEMGGRKSRRWRRKAQVGSCESRERIENTTNKGGLMKLSE